MSYLHAFISFLCGLVILFAFDISGVPLGTSLFDFSPASSESQASASKQQQQSFVILMTLQVQQVPARLSGVDPRLWGLDESELSRKAGNLLVEWKFPPERYRKKKKC